MTLEDAEDLGFSHGWEGSWSNPFEHKSELGMAYEEGFTRGWMREDQNKYPEDDFDWKDAE